MFLDLNFFVFACIVLFVIGFFCGIVIMGAILTDDDGCLWRAKKAVVKIFEGKTKNTLRIKIRGLD